MKKLLVSDYDMTFKYRDEKLCKDEVDNIIKVKKFIDDGNIFMISTARQYKSILEAIKKYNIPYNYLSCLNSNLVLDSSGNILSINYLDSDEMQCIINQLYKEYYYRPIDYNGNVTLTNMIAYQFYLKSKEIITLDKIPNVIRDNFGYDYYCNSGYIYSSKYKKDYGVELIKKKENIEKQNIFTIGDEIDDIPMIKEYNGYTVNWGNETKKYALDTVDSVGQLVDKIEKNKVLIRRI